MVQGLENQTCTGKSSYVLEGMNSKMKAYGLKKTELQKGTFRILHNMYITELNKPGNLYPLTMFDDESILVKAILVLYLLPNSYKLFSYIAF